MKCVHINNKNCMICYQRRNHLQACIIYCFAETVDETNTASLEMSPFLPNKDKKEEELHHEEG